MIVLQAGGGNILQSMWPLLLMFVVIYFFMIRPQAKKQKDQKNFLSDLQKGDEIATNSGLIGKINKIEDNVVHIQLDTKTFVKVLKSSVSKEMTDAIQKSE